MILFAILLSLYVWYLYNNSTCNFFKQDREVLSDKRQLLSKVLKDFEVDVDNDNRWLTSFDNFRDYPDLYDFDGATIVKDIYTINGYDAPASNHDYSYYQIKTLPFLKWLKESTKLDWQYSQDMRQLNIDWITAYSRFFALVTIVKIGYIIKYRIFK